MPCQQRRDFRRDERISLTHPGTQNISRRVTKNSAIMQYLLCKSIYLDLIWLVFWTGYPANAPFYELPK